MRPVWFYMSRTWTSVASFIEGAAGETDRRFHLISNCGRLGLFSALWLTAAAPMIGKIPDVIKCAANYKLSSAGAAVYSDTEPVVVKVTFANLSDHAAKIIPDVFEYDLEIRVSSLCWRSTCSRRMLRTPSRPARNCQKMWKSLRHIGGFIPFIDER
jgi:hypothetical protein